MRTQIDFNSLPNQFVVKRSHDSGSVRVVKDRSQLDVDNLKIFLNKRLKTNPWILTRECPYKHVKPQILVESYMGEFVDYKFFCFNGVVKCFEVAFDHTDTSCRANYYDRDIKRLGFEHLGYPQDYSRAICFDPVDKMIAIAEELSRDIPFLRVDLYDVNGRIYLGELTFYPDAGYGRFEPMEADYTLGSWLELPQRRSFFRRKTS